MMLNLKKIISIFMLVLFSVIISGCDDSEVTAAYSFEVISSDDGFVGYYKLNSDTAKEFSSLPLGTSVVYHSFEKDMSSPTSILISVTGATKDTSSISIYIYENSELADSITVSQSDSSVKVTASLSYTFGESGSE